MKKLVAFIILLISSTFIWSQDLKEDEAQRNNELHLNVLYPIAFKSFEASYERILNEDNSFGVSALYANYENLNHHYMISPYYRKYFSNGYAKGFFLDVFVSANGGKYENYDSYSYYDEEIDNWVYIDNSEEKNYNDVAFGIGAGVKFLTSDHFVGMLQGGIARNLFTSDYPSELIGKGGISIGYRF